MDLPYTIELYSLRLPSDFTLPGVVLQVAQRCYNSGRHYFILNWFTCVRRISSASTQEIDGSKDTRRAMLATLTRVLLVAMGTSFVMLGIVGIFLPLLPTTPFFLLAALCYARSSRRFHNWLLTNRLFGDYIRNYMERKGIPLRVKVLSISLLWITIGCSAVFAVDILLVRILLAAVAVGVTAHILSIRTLKQ